MKLPNKLSYQRSIHPSEVCFLVAWPGGKVTPLRKRSLVVLGMHEGTHSAYKKDGSIDEEISPTKLAVGNPHEIDYCNVPYGAEAIRCEFSVTIENKVTSPYACIDPIVANTLNDLVKAYQAKIGFDYLAERYLSNIINGVWLWDNKTTNSTTITITPSKGSIFEATDVQVKRFDPGWEKDLPNWQQLVSSVTKALLNPRDYLSLEVKATLIYPLMKEIKPSQVFKVHQRGKGRLYQTTTIDGEESPTFGAYKTGAAIAMIDDWFPGAQEPIRVNHYGVDKTNGICYRHPDSELDIFSLLRRADELLETLTKNQPLGEDILNQLHFIMANLIKGGPLQQKGY